MKKYQELHLQSISYEKYAQCAGFTYEKATQVLGACSLTSVYLEDENGVEIEKDRVWMSVGGGVWGKTSFYAPVSTVKGTYDNLPVIRAAKFEKAVPMTADDARKAIGVCSLAKVALCDADGYLIEKEGEVVTEVVWLSFSGTYWARVGGNVDKNIGIVL